MLEGWKRLVVSAVGSNPLAVAKHAGLTLKGERKSYMGTCSRVNSSIRTIIILALTSRVVLNAAPIACGALNELLYKGGFMLAYLNKLQLFAVCSI